jgi:hypothetical protein
MVYRSIVIGWSGDKGGGAVVLFVGASKLILIDILLTSLLDENQDPRSPKNEITMAVDEQIVS